MHAFGDNARGTQRILKIQGWFKCRMTGIGREEIGDTLAAIGFVLLVAELQSRVNLDAEVGVVAKQLFIPSWLPSLTPLCVFGDQRLWSSGGEILSGDLAPHRLQDRTTVQLEGCSPGGLDLGFGLSIESGVGSGLDSWELEREGVLAD